MSRLKNYSIDEILDQLTCTNHILDEEDCAGCYPKRYLSELITKEAVPVFKSKNNVMTPGQTVVSIQAIPLETIERLFSIKEH